MILVLYFLSSIVSFNFPHNYDLIIILHINLIMIIILVLLLLFCVHVSQKIVWLNSHLTFIFLSCFVFESRFLSSLLFPLIPFNNKCTKTINFVYFWGVFVLCKTCEVLSGTIESNWNFFEKNFDLRNLIWFTFPSARWYRFREGGWRRNGQTRSRVDGTSSYRVGEHSKEIFLPRDQRRKFRSHKTSDLHGKLRQHWSGLFSFDIRRS